MRSVHVHPALGLTAQLTLLIALDATVGLGLPGWVVGIAVGVLLNATLDRALIRIGRTGLGAADLVTLTRATLVGGVAALVADSFSRTTPIPTLVALATVALILDAVDGQVARRTGNASALGARFDMETDAFLILVLSAYLAPSVGAWVLTIGAARYALLVAGWVAPWLREPVPYRYWRKVVAGTQGVTLTIAAADILPHRVSVVALIGALSLLTESFGRDVIWLRSSRRTHRVAAAYGRTIEYPLTALMSFVETSHDKNLVVVVLGDHQPATATIVSAPGPS